MNRPKHPATDGAHRATPAAASAPSTAPTLPLWLEDAPLEDPPTVDREYLTGYLWLRYEGYKDIDREAGKLPSRLHTFTAEIGAGARFCVWGTADLNQRLRRVSTRGYCVLHYGGTMPNVDRGGEPMHSWMVKLVPPGVTQQQLQEAMASSRADHEQLDVAIGRALVAQKERRAARGGHQGGELPPDHTDADRRF
jgi:hypothetical protein